MNTRGCKGSSVYVFVIEWGQLEEEEFWAEQVTRDEVRSCGRQGDVRGHTCVGNGVVHVTIRDRLVPRAASLMRCRGSPPPLCKFEVKFHFLVRVHGPTDVRVDTWVGTHAVLHGEYVLQVSIFACLSGGGRHVRQPSCHGPCN
jgi:hypothetical protein